jgi:hypothetical protein
LEPGIPDWKFPYVFSKRELFLMHREQREERLIWQHHAHVSSCLIFGFYGRDTIVYASGHSFSNKLFSKCKPTLDVGFVKLTSERFCGILSSAVICAAVVLWIFETILLILLWQFFCQW